MSINELVESDVKANDIPNRQGYNNKVPYNLRQALEKEHYKKKIILTNNECDGDCGTDDDGAGVCFCIDDC